MRESAIGIDVRAEHQLSARERELLSLAELDRLAPVEAWQVRGTNRQLAYSTHGIFRFFGKFPPPLVRHLIDSFTHPDEWVLDPMSGSGTTAVEALTMRRHVAARDVSPLSTLLCRVKTRHVPERDVAFALTRLGKRLQSLDPSSLPAPVDLRHADHWFLPETRASLSRLRAAIDGEPSDPIRELLLTAFLSTVRCVSKATTQQGRLFLDVATAKSDAWPTFASRAERYATAVASLPPRHGTQLRIEQHDARSAPTSRRRFHLAVTHPPYFNNYKYSSINSLELSWLGVHRRHLREREVREAFKLGKPERVTEYVEDLAAIVRRVSDQLQDDGTLALMMGDTEIRGTYLTVTRQLLGEVQARVPELALERVVLRVPRYTEASWVASQRRTANRVGVALCDFILVLSKRGRLR